MQHAYVSSWPITTVDVSVADAEVVIRWVDAVTSKLLLASPHFTIHVSAKGGTALADSANANRQSTRVFYRIRSIMIELTLQNASRCAVCSRLARRRSPRSTWRRGGGGEGHEAVVRPDRHGDESASTGNERPAPAMKVRHLP
jgi:hypothetical protein